MPYTTNPKMPRVRMEAVKLVRAGWSYRKVAAHTGYPIGTISKWVQKAQPFGTFLWIPTKSSRPRSSPRALPSEVEQAIVQQRLKRNRCAEVVHQELLQQNIQVSLSTVKRVLKRHHLLKQRSPWKRPHDPTPRPDALKPGDLVELDTIHIGFSKRFFVYTLLDVFSRWAYAGVFLRKQVKDSLQFVRDAQQHAPFPFALLQSDHGSEFSQGFTVSAGVPHRHTRVRCPEDNAHLERFNRTLQEECLNHVPASPRHYRRVLPEYLRYYNFERLHMGIAFKTPSDRFQGLDL